MGGIFCFSKLYGHQCKIAIRYFHILFIVVKRKRSDNAQYSLFFWTNKTVRLAICNAFVIIILLKSRFFGKKERFKHCKPFAFLYNRCTTFFRVCILPAVGILLCRERYESMKLLEERIVKDGQVRPGNIIKVDSFLNHQLDVNLLDEIGKEFYRIYKDDGINKILTIEASGIAIACMTARYFDVPVVFAKKAKSKNLDGEVFTSTVHSFTYGKDYDITLAKKFLGPEDRVLILDDFMAVGKAMHGLLDVCEQAGATVCGIGITIEKGFQSGGDSLRAAGYKLTSLAIVEGVDEEGNIIFRPQED